MVDNYGKNTNSHYATLIAFPLQQWLHERASMLRLYVHFLSCSRLNYKYTAICNITRQCYYFSIQSAAEGKITFFSTALDGIKRLTRRQGAVFELATSVYVPVASMFSR